MRRLLESEAGHDRVLIPGVDALRSFGTLLLTEPGTLGAEARHYRKLVKIGTALALPHDGGRLYVSRVNAKDQFCGNFEMEAQAPREIADLDGDVLDRSAETDSLEVRNWEPGDEYHRAGHVKAEKIKSLFQEYRILLWDRRRWPVLAIGEEIVWSPRFGVAAKFQANNASRSIVRVLYSAVAE
jgi:tRNA(Ile)-lysidine synthetase-like protein